MTKLWDLLNESPPPLVELFDPLPEMRVAPGTTALLIVDMEYGSVTEEAGIIPQAEAAGIDMAYYRKRLRTVIPNIASLQHAFRRAGFEVAFTKGRGTKGGHRLGGARVRPLAPRSPLTGAGRVGRRGVIDEIAPEKGELVIDKDTPGPFGVTNIDHALRILGIELLVVTGIVTDQCVEATVRGAFDFGYQVILVEDACATVSEKLHHAALLVMGDWFCKVESTNEIIAQVESL